MTPTASLSFVPPIWCRVSVLTYIYSAAYSPSAPVIEVGLRGPAEEGVEVRLTAFVDTGADATMLPIHILRRVGAEYIEPRYIRGVTGVRTLAETYLAIVHIGQQIIPVPAIVALLRGEEAVLGRDVLNHLVLTLDGPAEMLGVSLR